MVYRWACSCPNKHGWTFAAYQWYSTIQVQCSQEKIFQLKTFLWNWNKYLFILFEAQVSWGMTEPNLIHWLRCFVSFDFLRFFFALISIIFFVHTQLLSTYLFIVRFSFSCFFIHTLHNPHTWILDCRRVLVRCEKIERGNAIERQNVR